MPTLNPYQVEGRPIQERFHDRIRTDVADIGVVKHISGHITQVGEDYLFDQVSVLIKPRSWKKDITLSVSWNENTQGMVYTNARGREVKLWHRPYEENLEPSTELEVTGATFAGLADTYQKHLSAKKLDPFTAEQRYTTINLQWVIVLLSVLTVSSVVRLLDAPVLLVALLSLGQLITSVSYLVWFYLGSVYGQEKALEIFDTTSSVLTGVLKPGRTVSRRIADAASAQETWNRSDRSEKFYGLFSTESEQSLFVSHLQEVARNAGVEVLQGLKVSKVAPNIPDPNLQVVDLITGAGAEIASPIVEFTGKVDKIGPTALYYDGFRIYQWSNGAAHPL